MAAAPNIGLSSHPSRLINTPAARGIPIILYIKAQKIFLYISQGVSRKADGARRLHEAAACNDHVGRVDCNVGSGTHRHAHICGRKGGSVIYAVAHHNDHSVLLVLFNGVLFAVGKHSGNNLVDSHLLCDGVGGF